MKRFILRLFLFVNLAGFFYITSLVVWTLSAPSMFNPNVYYNIGGGGHMFSRLSEVKNQEDLDVLFLGASSAYRGFDTRIFSDFGLRTFNLGSSSQTPIQTKVLLKRYLEKLNPKAVIFAVNPSIFNMDGVESSCDIIANDKNDLNSLKMALRINNIKTYNTLIYGFTRDFMGLNTSFNEPVTKGPDKYVSGGFVETERGFYQPTQIEEKEISINPNQLKSFTKIVQMLESKNIELILVYAPIVKDEYRMYNNIGYFDSLMMSYSKYYNFNEIVSLNDTLHYYDARHLNQNGVSLFNAKLIEIIYEK